MACSNEKWTSPSKICLGIVPTQTLAWHLLRSSYNGHPAENRLKLTIQLPLQDAIISRSKQKHQEAVENPSFGHSEVLDSSAFQLNKLFAA